MLFMMWLCAAQSFFDNQNNIYIIVALAVAVLALLVIVVVSLPRKNKGTDIITTDKPLEAGESVNLISELSCEVAAGAEAMDLVTEGTQDISGDSEKLEIVTKVNGKQRSVESGLVAEVESLQNTEKKPEIATKADDKQKRGLVAEVESLQNTEKKPSEESADEAKSIEKNDLKKNVQTGITEEKTKKTSAEKAKVAKDSADKPVRNSGKKTMVDGLVADKDEKATAIKLKKTDKKDVAEMPKASDEKQTAKFIVLDEDMLHLAPADGDVTEEDGKETHPGSIEIYKDKKEGFHFRFRAMNGSIVGHSQVYKAKESCKNGIRSVIATCEVAEIVDNTKRDSDYVPTIGKAVFEIYKDSIGQYRFRLLAKNATNILASQGYTTKVNCVKGAESIIRMSKNHSVVDSTVRRKNTGV